MADLKPTIVRTFDSARFDAGGGVVEEMTVRFTLGKYGPFEIVVPRGVDRSFIDEQMRKRARQLEGLVE